MKQKTTDTTSESQTTETSSTGKLSESSDDNAGDGGTSEPPGQSTEYPIDLSGKLNDDEFSILITNEEPADSTAAKEHKRDLQKWMVVFSMAVLALLIVVSAGMFAFGGADRAEQGQQMLNKVLSHGVTLLAGMALSDIWSG